MFLFREFKKDVALDFSVGSGAAAIAARYSGIAYRGWAHNVSHRDWLMKLFDRIFAALVLKKVVPAETELISGVEAYLRRTADAASYMLPKEKLTLILARPSLARTIVATRTSEVVGRWRRCQPFATDDIVCRGAATSSVLD